MKTCQFFFVFCCGLFAYTASQTQVEAKQQAICGADDLKTAICFFNDQNTKPMYETARAVARMLIKKQKICTGWLLGEEGHLVTNTHCVADQSEVSKMFVEFGGESRWCETKCERQRDCPSTRVAPNL